MSGWPGRRGALWCRNICPRPSSAGSTRRRTGPGSQSPATCHKDTLKLRNENEWPFNPLSLVKRPVFLNILHGKYWHWETSHNQISHSQREVEISRWCPNFSINFKRKYNLNISLTVLFFNGLINIPDHEVAYYRGENNQRGDHSHKQIPHNQFSRMIDSFYISALLGTAVNGWVEAEGGSDHRKWESQTEHLWK